MEMYNVLIIDQITTATSPGHYLTSLADTGWGGEFDAFMGGVRGIRTNCLEIMVKHCRGRQEETPFFVYILDQKQCLQKVCSLSEDRKSHL